MENDSSLQKTAQRFLGLMQEIKRAEHEVSQAESRASGIRTELANLTNELATHVGQNIPHKLVTTPIGTIFISHYPSNRPIVMAFNMDGEEIR